MAENTVTLVHEEGLRVTAESGNVLVFQPGVPREVPAFLARDCRRQGCFPPGGAAPVPPEPELVDDTIERLVAAVEAVYDLGDPQLLTEAGLPRRAEVKSRVDFKFTDAQLAAAVGRIDASA